MTWKKNYFNVFLQKQLTDIKAPLMGALRWRDIQISTAVFPPTVYNSLTHYV